MARNVRATAPPLIDAVRPLDADGPLVSLVCSTYGLALDQPNFFEQDFLPTVLGLGGVRDRGYAVPVALERRLKELHAALVADAHALAGGGRPSLQIDVLPVTDRTNHAKLVLLHRKRLIRLVITSANLTHEGYRRQREVGAVLDFKEDGPLPVGVLRKALRDWVAVLGDMANGPMRDALDAAVRQAEGWRMAPALPDCRGVAVVFGGGPKPLWRALVDAWPEGEPLLDWYVCSPFWPDVSEGQTPFEAVAGGLEGRGASLEEARLHLITCADSPGERGRPRFPFPLARRLYEGGFPVRRGRIAPVRLEALPGEVPEGMAEDQRPLHAKWVLLRGPRTAVVLLGSANFTRKGMGVLDRPEKANIEACVLLTLPAEAADPQSWLPPLAEKGVVDLAACQEAHLNAPQSDEDPTDPWPAFIARVELEVRWEDGPDPVGSVRIVLRPEQHPDFAVSLVPEHGEMVPSSLLVAPASEGPGSGPYTKAVDGPAVRRVLASRSVLVCWGQPPLSARFPVNIDEHSKAGLPSVLGARPDEQQLLAYFHGRIGEEDLVELLETRAAQAAVGGQPPPPVETERLRRLQSYLLRDFVESLFGLTDALRQATRSPRAFEQALVGDFSPASLADQILEALRTGRRSATAAAFQLVELLRVVSGLELEGEDALSAPEREAMEEVRGRAVSRLLRVAALAGAREDFRRAGGDRDFSSYAASSLPPPVFDQWSKAVLKDVATTTAFVAPRTEDALA
jgi:hypothetical protein